VIDIGRCIPAGDSPENLPLHHIAFTPDGLLKLSGTAEALHGGDNEQTRESCFFIVHSGNPPFLE
jgi:hypothetical protein